MQKVVSVYLDIAGFSRDSGLRLSNSDIHGRTQEHLSEYLDQGWKVVNLTNISGPGTGGWMVAVLEKVS